MVRKAEELYREALALSDDERIKLLRLLTGAQGQGYASPEIGAAWQDEIDRREREIAEGKSDWLPGSEVMAELGERYGR
jgi:putative addiction module component (TIGR02574 family)